MKRNNISKSIFSIAIIVVILAGCKKFVTADTPNTQIPAHKVFSDDKTAESAVVGMYSYMYQLNNALSTFGGWHLTVCNGMAADELNRPGLPSDPFLINALSADLGEITSLWQSCYSAIYNANAIIDGLQESSGVTENVKKQLTGEALFVRSFVHFYLVNLFGDVPLVTTANVRVTSSLGRASTTQIYEQIIKDLLQAKDFLPNDYTFSSQQRVRANKWAAAALLARIYLYVRDWTNAETQASSVIDNNDLYTILPDLSTVFYKNSKEAIWQFFSFGGNGYTNVGLALIPSSSGTIPNYTINDFLLDAFEIGDLRATAWISESIINGETYFYPYKYRQRTATQGASGEYDMVFRLAEQYLIRAEARAQESNFSGARSDLNIIRNRAGLSDTEADDGPSILSLIEKERQTELFVEWGHRWLDLKRTGRIDFVLGAQKTNWVPELALFPIPEIELSKNPNLTQNMGY